MTAQPDKDTLAAIERGYASQKIGDACELAFD